MAAGARKLFGWLKRAARRLLLSGPTAERLVGAVFVLFTASIVIPFSATNTLPGIGVRMASVVSLLTATQAGSLADNKIVPPSGRENRLSWGWHIGYRRGAKSVRCRRQGYRPPRRATPMLLTVASVITDGASRSVSRRRPPGP